MKSSTYEILNTSTGLNRWVLVISREDGSTNDYRFKTKRDLLAWVKQVNRSTDKTVLKEREA